MGSKAKKWFIFLGDTYNLNKVCANAKLNSSDKNKRIKYPVAAQTLAS